MSFFGPLGAFCSTLYAQFQDRLVEMPNRRCGLQAGVEIDRGLERSMTQNATDSLILAGIGIEIQLGTQVAEKVRMNPQSCVGADGS
jgi:hypothetical protein